MAHAFQAEKCPAQATRNIHADQIDRQWFSTLWTGDHDGNAELDLLFQHVGLHGRIHEAGDDTIHLAVENALQTPDFALQVNPAVLNQ